MKRLDIFASNPDPPVKQMRDQVIVQMRQPNEASFHNTAVDSSANQGLGDDLMIYAGADCLQVNNSVRASEEPIRANDVRPAKETIYDRGTESWCVLAEFCKANMVRGLPATVVQALTSRRFAVKKGKNGAIIGQAFPLRLEDKAEFKKRYKHSPDETDACSLAALAAKERIGLLPFGYVRPPDPRSLMIHQGSVSVGIDVRQDENYSGEFADDDTYDDLG